MKKHYIYINSFWGGFVNKTDANHIGFFETLFKKTAIKNFEITSDINKATILLESIFGNSLCFAKTWDYKFHYSGEPISNNHNNYTIALDSEHGNDKNNVVDLPLFVYYIHQNNYLERLLQKPLIGKSQIPTKFCCFIVSNGNCIVRNEMFRALNNYKRVDSYGKYCNNMSHTINHGYWTEEYRDIIRKYKFIICFENTKKGTYITEKIINPYLSNIIPIYWGTHNVKKVLNTDSFLFLNDETSKSSFIDLINKVVELDTDDEKYLKMVNAPVFTNDNLSYWNDNYTIECMAKKIDLFL